MLSHGTKALCNESRYQGGELLDDENGGEKSRDLVSLKWTICVVKQ